MLRKIHYAEPKYTTSEMDKQFILTKRGWYIGRILKAVTRRLLTEKLLCNCRYKRN